MVVYYDGRKGLVCGVEGMEVWILLSGLRYGEGDGVLVNRGEEEIYQKNVFWVCFGYRRKRGKIKWR